MLESSINDLYKSTVEAFPRTTKRQHVTQPIQIEHMTFVPFLGMKTLLVKASALNETREYNTLILFKNVLYKENGKLEIPVGKNSVKLEQLSVDNDILVRCNCPDFSYRFRHYDKIDKSLYGKDGRKYESKGIGPPANPLEMPGACKHLLKVFEVLGNSGLLTTT